MMKRKNIGMLLIWLGVLIWLPYLYLLADGQNPLIYPFLAVHLTGVIGGSRLRKLSSPKRYSKMRPRRQIIGRVMIVLGAATWAPYLYQKEILNQPVEIAPYLTVHLIGVLGGSLLLASSPLMQFLEKNRSYGD
ncbi:MAG: hypothetical protein PVG14_04585 [Anaerolineales bacterium]|jgi:hypothetical protein